MESDDDMAIARKVMRENRESLRELSSGAKVSKDYHRVKHPITASAPETRAIRHDRRIFRPKSGRRL